MVVYGFWFSSRSDGQTRVKSSLPPSLLASHSRICRNSSNLAEQIERRRRFNQIRNFALGLDNIWQTGRDVPSISPPSFSIGRCRCRRQCRIIISKEKSDFDGMGPKISGPILAESCTSSSFPCIASEHVQKNKSSLHGGSKTCRIAF